MAVDTQDLYTELKPGTTYTIMFNVPVYPALQIGGINILPQWTAGGANFPLPNDWTDKASSYLNQWVPGSSPTIQSIDNTQFIANMSPNPWLVFPAINITVQQPMYLTLVLEAVEAIRGAKCTIALFKTGQSAPTLGSAIGDTVGGVVGDVTKSAGSSFSHSVPIWFWAVAALALAYPLFLHKEVKP